MNYLKIVFKIFLMIYLLLIPFIDNNFILFNLDNNIIKIGFVVIVLLSSYIDNGIGLLLTLSFILSINYRINNNNESVDNLNENFKNNSCIENNIDESLFNINLENDNYYKYDYNY